MTFVLTSSGATFVSQQDDSVVDYYPQTPFQTIDGVVPTTSSNTTWTLSTPLASGTLQKPVVYAAFYDNTTGWLAYAVVDLGNTTTPQLVVFDYPHSSDFTFALGSSSVQLTLRDSPPNAVMRGVILPVSTGGLRIRPQEFLTAPASTSWETVTGGIEYLRSLVPQAVTLVHANYDLAVLSGVESTTLWQLEVSDMLVTNTAPNTPHPWLLGSLYWDAGLTNMPRTLALNVGIGSIPLPTGNKIWVMLDVPVSYAAGLTWYDGNGAFFFGNNPVITNPAQTDHALLACMTDRRVVYWPHGSPTPTETSGGVVGDWTGKEPPLYVHNEISTGSLLTVFVQNNATNAMAIGTVPGTAVEVDARVYTTSATQVVEASVHNSVSFTKNPSVTTEPLAYLEVWLPVAKEKRVGIVPIVNTGSGGVPATTRRPSSVELKFVALPSTSTIKGRAVTVQGLSGVWCCIRMRGSVTGVTGSGWQPPSDSEVPPWVWHPSTVRHYLPLSASFVPGDATSLQIQPVAGAASSVEADDFASPEVCLVTPEGRLLEFEGADVSNVSLALS